VYIGTGCYIGIKRPSILEEAGDLQTRKFRVRRLAQVAANSKMSQHPSATQSEALASFTAFRALEATN
jgi:hypothetical protein